MSTNEIQNLLVRISPEGVDETNEALEEQGQTFEDVSEDVGESTGRLEDFSERWSGAMTTITAGLAIATAGLLTQVPVIGEAFGGVTAVVDALAFQMDRALRPAVGGLTRDMFDLSEQMFAADGPIEALGILGQQIEDIGAASISIAIEEDVVATAVDNLVRIVFPEIGEKPILNAVFSANITGAAVLAFLFGGTAITTARVLSFMLPASIGATTVLAFMLPIITGGAILGAIFPNVNMTEASILSVIFAGVALTAALIIGATFGPVTIAGAAIVGVLFTGVTITADMILQEVFGADFEEIVREGAQTIRTQERVEGDGFIQRGAREVQRDLRGGGGNTVSVLGFDVFTLDGRQMTEDTGRYRSDRTTRRGRGP